MKYRKLIPMPLGEITAYGWLKEQLERNRDGIGGHMDELEPKMIATPFTEHVSLENWGGAGWGGEISGNYWYGLVTLAYTLHDDFLMKKAETWVNRVLSMQEEDGYMGAYAKTDNRFEDYNAWGTACGMRAMLAFYEGTGRQDVFEAVYRCMLWFCVNWATHKTPYAGHAITEPMLYCYDRTGDQRLLQFVLDYDRFLSENDEYNNSTETLAIPKLRYNVNHTVAYGISLRRPALIYGSTGDRRYLDAADTAIQKIRAKAVQETGAPVSRNEWLAPVSATVESETCNFAVYNADYAIMASLTGDTSYGDYMEQVVYNAAEGARKTDERAITYMSAPNQIKANRHSSYTMTWHSMYTPIHPTSCCAVYSVHILPDLVKNMVMTDAEGNWVFQAYGPCQICHDSVTALVDTLYPFGESLTIRLSMDAPKTFGMTFKIPGWCRQYSIKVNGREVEPTCCREWQDGDVIAMHFEMKPTVSRVDDSNGSKNYPLCIKNGPLVYALQIPENWIDIGTGEARTPLPEGWCWYELEPAGPKCWDVALDEKTVADSIEVVRTEKDGYVWENPPVKLTLDAYKAPYAYQNFITKTPEIFEEELEVTEKQRLTLVPYGCTAIRITYFPRADMGTYTKA